VRIPGKANAVGDATQLARSRPRTDPQIHEPIAPIIFFDGVCALCSGSVDLILRADRKREFFFAPLQGETAKVRLPALPQDTSRWSMVLLDETGTHRESDAVLEICRRLGGAWRIVTLARHLPRPLPDRAYRLIARNRYRIFGRRFSCRVPTAEERARFLP
jgi:predicted DCC family thiol-disulfide oxidoreductase YuxK